MPIRKPILLLLITAMALPAPASAVVRPFAKPSANAQKSQQKQARAREKTALARDLSAAKAKVRNGRGFFQQQWKDMRQAARENARYKKEYDAADKRAKAAQQAYEQRPTEQAKQNANALELEARVSARKWLAAEGNADRAEGSFKRTREQRDAAVAELVAARQAVKRGPSGPRAPAYAAGAALPPATLPASYSVVQQPSLASVTSPVTQRMRSSSAAENGPLPNIPSTFGTPGDSTRSATSNSSRSESSRSTVYDLSFRQSEPSIRHSREFSAINPD